MEKFSVIEDFRFEGIEACAAKFQHILSNIKKKPYDVLDYRKLDFEHDYKEFRRSISDFEGLLRSYIASFVEKMPSTFQALKLLQKFDALNLPNLGVNELFKALLKSFGKDIEMIKRLYNTHRSDPPVPRDVPPVAGKILWARQLSRKLQEPMDIFMTKPECMRSDEAKKVIRNYNQTMKALVNFEVLYHHAWVQTADACCTLLQVPLLVRHPERKEELLVNLDPMVFELIHEASYIRKLDLEVPYSAKTLIYHEQNLKKNQAQLQVSSLMY